MKASIRLLWIMCPVTSCWGFGLGDALALETGDQNTAIAHPDLFKLGMSANPERAPLAYASFAPTGKIEMIDRTTASLSRDDAALEITVTRKLGQDVLFQQTNMGPGTFDAGQAWRFEADANWRAEAENGLLYDVGFGVFDYRRPFLSTRGGIGLDLPDLWRRQTVIDTSATLRTRDGRFSVSSGIALSETSLERGYFDEPWLHSLENRETPSQDREKSVGSFHSLDAEVFDTGSMNLSISADYTRSDEDFRNYQSQSAGDILYPGEFFAATFYGELAETGFKGSSETLRSSYYDLDETRLDLWAGAHKFDISLGHEVLKYDQFTLAEDKTVRARLRTDLSMLLQDKPKWAPDEVNFSVTRRTSAEPVLGVANEKVQNTFGVGFARYGDHFFTDISAYVKTQDEHFNGLPLQTGDAFGVDVMQDFYVSDWTVSLYASANDRKLRRGVVRNRTDTTVSGGASVTYEKKDVAAFSLSVDMFEDSTQYYLENDTYASHDYSFRASMKLPDILDFWKDRSDVNIVPIDLKVSAYHGWNGYADAYLPAEKERDTRFMVQMMRAF